MARTLHVDIVSAEQSIFSGEADMVIAPGEAGELGILPEHMPLLTRIKPGTVRIRRPGAEEQCEENERALEQRELGRRVESAMAELPEDQRAVLVLRAYHDLDYPEIAVALGIEEGTVKSRLSRARAALRSVLEARGVKP